MLSTEESGGCRTAVKERIERRKKLALKKGCQSRGTLRNTQVKRRDWSETVLAWPDGLRENAYQGTPQNRVGGLELPERRKRHASGRGDEEDARMCPSCGKAKCSKSLDVGECELNSEKRDVLEEETREIDQCDMEKFGALLDNNEKTIAILGGRRWPLQARQEGG